jgi:hypothetical protein
MAPPPQQLSHASPRSSKASERLSRRADHILHLRPAASAPKASSTSSAGLRLNATHSEPAMPKLTVETKLSVNANQILQPKFSMNDGNPYFYKSFYPCANLGLYTGPTLSQFIGAYSRESRKERIQKFIDKRNRRIWTKKVKYDVRKNFADSRVRVKGRFVKKEAEDVLKQLLTEGPIKN